jgi:Uma2 family endonuclease
MATATVSLPANLADLLKQLGSIPPWRIQLHPAPGTATEQDLLVALDPHGKRICELVDGVLVEKAMGFKESLLAMEISRFLHSFIRKNDLGIVLGADATFRIMPSLVRIPDVAFVSWESLPGEEVPEDPIPDLTPDLAIEVLSKGNTRKEMERKLWEYFEGGARVVWLVQPKTQTAEIYSSPTDCRHIPKNGVLEAEGLLPDFKLPLRKLFESTKRRRSRR